MLTAYKRQPDQQMGVAQALLKAGLPMVGWSTVLLTSRSGKAIQVLVQVTSASGLAPMIGTTTTQKTTFKLPVNGGMFS